MEGLGLVRTQELIKRAARRNEIAAGSLAVTVDALAVVPASVYAVFDDPDHYLFLDFGTALTPATLDDTAWTGTVATNGGAPAALTVTAVVATSRRVAVALSGSPFEPDAQSVQAVTLAYTPSGTNDLLDAAGRTVLAFTVDAVVPRQDNPNAAFMLMAEQGSNPTGDPPAGFWRLFAKSDGFYTESPAGVVTGPIGALFMGFSVGDVFTAVVNTDPAVLLGYGTWQFLGSLTV